MKSKNHASEVKSIGTRLESDSSHHSFEKTTQVKSGLVPRQQIHYEQVSLHTILIDLKVIGKLWLKLIRTRSRNQWKVRHNDKEIRPPHLL